MGQALKESGFKRVTAATHGWLHELLLTLPEAVKKSSHFARDITKTGQKEGELERVYEYQTRSSYTGSRMFLCEARAPGLFLRCRENLGFNSGAVSRGLRVDTDDGFFQCSNWYLTKTSDVCYKVIDEEEKEQILGMLDSYEEYTREEPYTLLPHFYAILTMSAPGKPRVNFLVTKNILHTLDIINEVPIASLPLQFHPSPCSHPSPSCPFAGGGLKGQHASHLPAPLLLKGSFQLSCDASVH